METLALYGADLVTSDEADRLIELEGRIERGLHTFVDVGNALLEIRDGRLYRSTHGTFEDYCRERWGMVRQHANRLIAAAEVAGNLEPVGSILDVPERALRPLARLEPEEQRIAWQTAVETAPNGKVTAAHVEHVVAEMRNEAAPAWAPPHAGEVHEEHDCGMVELSPATLTEHSPALPPPDTLQHSTSSMAVHFSSESPEHYSPQHVIERVIACMGGIDLDPCSNSHDAPNVPAAAHFTPEDDGLAQVWRGTVYMNPPYGREIDAWVEKLASEYHAGNVTEAIALVPARTDTQWWQRLNEFHVCFVVGRLTFIGNSDPAPFPSAVVYMGSEVGNFAAAFDDLGPIWHQTRRGFCYGE